MRGEVEEKAVWTALNGKGDPEPLKTAGLKAAGVPAK